MTILNLTLTDSGFGDRIIDLWSVMLVAKCIGSDVKSVWIPKELSHLKRDYSLDLFSQENNEFIYDPEVDNYNIVFSLRSFITYPPEFKYEGGSSTPYHLLKSNGDVHYGKDYSSKRIQEVLESFSIEDLNNMFLQVAEDLKPSTDILERIPVGIENYVGIHIRRTDKLSNKVNLYEVTKKEDSIIIHNSLKYIKQSIQSGQYLYFIATDDIEFGKVYKKLLEQEGAWVTMHQYSSNIPGYSELLDFFTLSKCKSILQVTKYSNFSVAAALCGSKKLINCLGSEMNKIVIWKDLLDISFVDA